MAGGGAAAKVTVISKMTVTCVPAGWRAGRLVGAGDGVVVSFGVRKEFGARNGRETPRKARKGLEQGMRVWEAGGRADAIRPYGGR
jgi:hypothetical protein